MITALAPMATLTHEALRLLIHRFGDPTEYYSEMIHAPSYVCGGVFEKWYVRTAPAPDKMVWQLTGPTPSSMAQAAALLLPLGGLGIDVNMGCSAPDIVKTGCGIAWMSKEGAEVRTLISSIRSCIDQYLTDNPGQQRRFGVKLRLGEDEDYTRLLDFCRMLIDEGVEQLTLHPRTRREKYGRPPRHGYTVRLGQDIGVPVYGNGAISSAGEAVSFMEKYPCSGLMIGRAAITRPWIFRQIELGLGAIPQEKDRRAIDLLELSLFFLDRLVESQPPEFFMTRARRFFFYFCDNLSFAHHCKTRIQNAKAPEHIRDLLEAYFRDVPQDQVIPGIAPEISP